MVEISNDDIKRILVYLDVAEAHFNSLKGLRNRTQAWVIARLKDKIIRKIKKNQKTNENDQTGHHQPPCQ